MKTNGKLEKTLPASLKKIRGTEYGGGHLSTVDNAVMTRMEHYLDRSESPEVENEELEYYLLGPEESDVDIRALCAERKRRKASKAFPRSVREQVSSWWPVWRDVKSTQECLRYTSKSAKSWAKLSNT